MRRVVALLAALGLSLSGPVAFAQPGSWATIYGVSHPTLLGTVASTTSPATITTGASVGAGTPILVFGYTASSLSTTTVTDTVSNTYAARFVVPSANKEIGAGYVGSSTALPSGDFITLARLNATTINGLAVSDPSVLNTAPFDNSSAGATGTSSTPSATEGTVVNAARRVYGLVVSTQNGVTTEAAGWTSVGTSPSAASLFLHVAYIDTTSATQNTYAPTLGSSIAWVASTVSFQQ